ncbi:MAG: hypothetical protein ACRD3W_20135, partial [Terriglobales bacterium]
MKVDSGIAIPRNVSLFAGNFIWLKAYNRAHEILLLRNSNSLSFGGGSDWHGASGEGADGGT